MTETIAVHTLGIRRWTAAKTGPPRTAKWSDEFTPMIVGHFLFP